MRWLTKRERNWQLEGRSSFHTWFAWYPVTLSGRPEQWAWMEKVTVIKTYRLGRVSERLYTEYTYHGL